MAHLPHIRACLRARMGPAFRARESTSDLVQSVCREVLEARDRFEYRGPAAFCAWLSQAAAMKLGSKRRFHAQARRDVRRERGEEDLRVSQIVAGSLSSPVDAAVIAEERDRIEALLDELPDEQREILTLAKILGLSHVEIAEQLGITLEMSRQRLKRAVARLGTLYDLRYHREQG